MDASLTAALPAALKIVGRSENGSIQVEFPVLVVGTIDTSLAAKGKGTLAVTEAMLDEIAANFREWPGPLPLNVAPHREWSETSGPAPAFVDALERRQDKLWARCTINQPLASEVEAGLWRGFSVDLAKSPRLPAKALTGWCMWAGVFTNRPAADVTFVVDAVAAEAAVEVAQIQVSLVGDRAVSRKEKVMATEGGLSLEAQLESSVGKIAALTAQIEDIGGERDKAQLEAAAMREQNRKIKADAEIAIGKVTSLEAELKVARKRADEYEAQALASRVTDIAKRAIKAGVAPAFFEGHDDDPAAWLKKSFISLEAFETFAAALPKRSLGTAVSSGNTTDDTDPIPAERAKELRRLGLDPKYALVTSADQLHELKK